MSRPKLLVVTRHSPLPENDGAGAYLFDLVSYLAANGFEIEVAWIHSEDSLRHKKWWKVPARFRETARLTIIGTLAIGPWRYFHWGLLKARVGGFFKKQRARPQATHTSSTPATAANLPAPPSAKSAYDIPSWSDLPTPLETRFFRQRFEAFRPDAVLVNYCWLTPLLKDLPASLQTAILTCDVISHRIAPSPHLDPDPGTPAGEAALLKCARHILAISEGDAAVFRGWLPQHSIVITPKAATVRPLPATLIEPLRILFVGGMNTFNRDGLAWFLEHVWPRVIQSQPQAVLHICGAIGSTVAQPPARVIIKGRVPDLTAEYAAAAIVIVPLLDGSGVKIKLVEAASYGKAIVTTPVGLQGLDFLRPTVREASTPATFADAVLSLLSSESERLALSAATLQAAETHLSKESCYRPTRDALLGDRLRSPAAP